jgi:hypothetical protein
MINAHLLDAGTYPRKNPATYPSVPGMDRVYYNEGDFEEDNADPRPEEINELIRDVQDFELEPWPEEFSGKCYIDNTRRYQSDGLDGLQLNLHRYHRLTDETNLVPAGEWTLDLDATQELDRAAGRVVRELTWREVQDRADDPTQYLRLDFINQDLAGTNLKDPLFARWRSLRGKEYRLELPDNVLFAPFDLTHAERYRVLHDDGTRVDPELSDDLLNMYNGGRYRLYLRPRKWRYVATVVAHYWYISAFEYFRAQEIFTRAHTQRPPFFPYRHDLIHTTQTADIPDYWGIYHSYDVGISWQWEHSRSAAALSREIIEGQYFTKLVVKLFGGNEYPVVVISTRPADPDDIVLGIGRIDSSGRESRYWIQQTAELSSVYPWEVIGSYIVPWTVTV